MNGVQKETNGKRMYRNKESKNKNEKKDTKDKE